MAWEKRKDPLLRMENGCQPLISRRHIAMEIIAFFVHDDCRESSWIHLHAPRIARIQHLFRQIQKRLSNKCPTGIEYRRRNRDIIPILLLHFLHHKFHALGVRHIGGYTDRFTAGLVDGVNDGGVGIWIAGKESNVVGGGEFAGYGCAGLQ